MYPLWLEGASETERIKSNIVAVRIKQPAGEDAKVWEQLSDPSLLTLLQVEMMHGVPNDAPMKIAKLLRSFPASGYAVALRHALSKTYFRSRLDLAEKDQELLAQSLDIAHVETIADERLAALRKDRVLEKEIPLGTVLASLGKSGISFGAAPELLGKKVTLLDAYGSLRLSMRSLSDDLEATWERRRDGYFLAPYDPANPKRLKVKGGR